KLWLPGSTPCGHGVPHVDTAADFGRPSSQASFTSGAGASFPAYAGWFDPKTGTNVDSGAAASPARTRRRDTGSIAGHLSLFDRSDQNALREVLLQERVDQQ